MKNYTNEGGRLNHIRGFNYVPVMYDLKITIHRLIVVYRLNFISLLCTKLKGGEL